MKKVAIIMGSDSDFPVVSKAVKKLKVMKTNFACFYQIKPDQKHFQCFFVQKRMLKEIIAQQQEK